MSSSPGRRHELNRRLGRRDVDTVGFAPRLVKDTGVTGHRQNGLEFQILGSLFVTVSDESGRPRSIAVGPAKERSLLVALVLHPNQTVSPDALIEMLWGEHPPPSARKLLQIYVSHLRKTLGDDVVGTRSPGYELQVEPEAIDAGRFERLFLAGSRAMQQGDAALASALLRQGLALWRGPALADFRYDDFARISTDRLEELRLIALEELADADLTLHRHGEIVGELQALLAAHPLRERLRAQLMLALYRCDRQAEALRVYDDGRRELLDELGLEPGRPLQALEHAILEHDPALDLEPTPQAPRSRPSSLPSSATPLIGRDRELRELEDLILAPETRLVTVTGPGGIGKTRLAVAASASARPRFANGVVFVDLSALIDPALVIVAIAEAIEQIQPFVRLPRRSLGESVAAAIGRQHLLLVLDNLEQVAAAAPELGALLSAAPYLSIVATSRVRLRLSGERVYAVPPLAVPAPRDVADIAILGRVASVQLFVERAGSVAQDFALSPDNASAVAHICTRLEGVPLAIELAAPRVAMLTPHELVERLEPRLPLLADGAWDLPARQRTLRATIDWSYALLSPSQRRLLGRLALFSGGWTLDAAERVCGPGDVLADLTMLLENSLVRRTGAASAPRYTMLETVREYALEQWATDPESEAQHQHVSEYFVSFAARAEPELSGAEQTKWFPMLEAEHDNLRATLRWLKDTEQPQPELDLATSLGRYWYVRGHLDEGRRALEGALERAEAVATAASRAKGFRAASAVAVIQGDYGGARVLAERGLELYRAADDPVGVVRSLSNLGAILLGEGDTDRAIVALDESVELSRDLPDRRLAALALNNRGDVALTMGAYPEAATLFEESLALLRAAGDHANVARSLFNLGAATLESGNTGAAWALLDESLSLSLTVGDKEDVIWCLVAMSAVAARDGDPSEATIVLAGAMALLDEIGATMKPFERGLQERTITVIRSRLDEARFDAAWTSGKTIAFDDVIAAARRIRTSLN